MLRARAAPYPQSAISLEVEDVRKEFPGVLALDNVQFRLKRGTRACADGRERRRQIDADEDHRWNLYARSRRGSSCRGQDIRLNGPLDALENGIAMIHQELNLMPSMTVAENIWIRREPKNRFGFVDHGEMHRKTAELFKRLNIEHRSGSQGRRR